MLNALITSFLLIFISELGDKTFFVAAILAMRYPRRWVWLGAFSALAVMTAISASLGQMVRFLPRIYTHYGAIALLVVFGLLMLKQAWETPADHCGEATEAGELVDKTTVKPWLGGLGLISSTFSLTFLAEWGDRTQIATIDLATAYDPIWVVVMGILAHALCTVLAVLAGQALSKYLTGRTMAWIGGTLFLVFALATGIQGSV